MDILKWINLRKLSIKTLEIDINPRLPAHLWWSDASLVRDFGRYFFTNNSIGRSLKALRCTIKQDELLITIAQRCPCLQLLSLDYSDITSKGIII